MSVAEGETLCDACFSAKSRLLAAHPDIRVPHLPVFPVAVLLSKQVLKDGKRVHG